MPNATTILAGLAVMGAALVAERAPEPRGFGMVGCLIEPDVPGPPFRMTINDKPDHMIVRTSESYMDLPRDEELTEPNVHVGALTDGTRTIAVTLDRDLRATVTVIGGLPGVSIGGGQCERI